MRSMIARGSVLLGILCLLAGCANVAAPFKYAGKYGLVSREGKVIVPPDLVHMGDFAANGLALVETSVKHYGFMDASGRLVIPPIFEDVNHAGFCGGDALARVKMNNNGPWGDLDSKGNFFPVTEDGKSTHPEAVPWPDNYHQKYNVKKFEENGKFGLVNAEGKVLIPPRFDSLDNFSRAGFAVFREHWKEGLVNNKAEILIPPEFDAIADPCGVSFWARKGEREGYIDQRGEFIFQYSEACGTPTIVDRQNRIIWPPLSRAQICAESRKLPVNQARPGDFLHVCTEAPFPENDALCRIRLVDSREDEILVEYQDECTSQYKAGDQNWQIKGKVMPMEERAACEHNKTFCFSC